MEEFLSILASTDESSTDDDSDYGYISTYYIYYIRYGSHTHTNINPRYFRLKICYHVTQSKNEWKESELSENNIGKGLHKLFKTVVNEWNKSLPNLL